MRTVIIATLTAEQLGYLKQLAASNGIAAEFIVEGATVAEAEPIQVVTPITGTLLDQLAEATGKPVLELASLAQQWGINTVEQALAHEQVPAQIKELLESFI